jgi:uncharacterized protein involved in exopolysaccharide biosynthesis
VATGFDPEAEREVDFARYVRMLLRRWWLVAIGVIVGAVIGYLASLGGTKVFSATATIYLGQPYNGSTPILNLQVNPAAVGQIANSQWADAKVATQCHTNVESFRKGISVQKVASSTPAKGLAAQVNPLVTVTVQAAKGKVATCVANGLSRTAVAGLSDYSSEKVRNYESRIATDAADIKRIQAKLEAGGVSGSDVILLTTLLRSDQTDYSTYSQALFVANQVESPKLMVPARQRQVTAQSSKNTVIIAALIGLILGILGALLWDRIVPRLSARDAS